MPSSITHCWCFYLDVYAYIEVPLKLQLKCLLVGNWHNEAFQEIEEEEVVNYSNNFYDSSTRLFLFPVANFNFGFIDLYLLMHTGIPTYEFYSSIVASLNWK